jgi:hypothetical protein
MVNRIIVSHSVYEPEHTSFLIGIDGVIRTKHKAIGDTMWVTYVSRTIDMVTDAQCQAVSTLVLASFIKYGLTQDNLSTIGLGWDEILRRA